MEGWVSVLLISLCVFCWIAWMNPAMRSGADCISLYSHPCTSFATLVEQCLLKLAEEAKHDPLEAFMQRINNSFCFFSVETHMLGMQRFWETHFMLIVYLIRNSNCLVGLINLWKSNTSIVYLRVMLFVYAYKIFIPWQGSLATTTSLWCDFVWSQVSWRCHHQLPWQETWNNVKGVCQLLRNNTESSCNKRQMEYPELDSVPCGIYSKRGFDPWISEFSAEYFYILKVKAGIIQGFYSQKSHEKNETNNALVCVSMFPESPREWLSAPRPLVPTKDVNLQTIPKYTVIIFLKTKSIIKIAGDCSF